MRDFWLIFGVLLPIFILLLLFIHIGVSEKKREGRMDSSIKFWIYTFSIILLLPIVLILVKHQKTDTKCLENKSETLEDVAHSYNAITLDELDHYGQNGELEYTLPLLVYIDEFYFDDIVPEIIELQTQHYYDGLNELVEVDGYHEWIGIHSKRNNKLWLKGFAIEDTYIGIEEGQLNSVLGIIDSCSYGVSKTNTPMLVNVYRVRQYDLFHFFCFRADLIKILDINKP